MVVYTGELQLRVRRLLEAIDEVTRITEERGGYVESLTSRVVVVRVPGEDFEQTMTAFEALGDVLDRRVRALDVTEQFTDLGGRLAVAKEARARLLELLGKVVDVEERLEILEEIKRLSEQIETLESTMATLRNLVDYFTITIELVPVLEQSSGEIHRSPFHWVRALIAHRTTIVGGRDALAMDLPAGFVLFSEDEDYRAQAADTTVLRAGAVENEPRGDTDFWADAVEFEMIGRGETVHDAGTSGPLRYSVFRSEDVQPRYYLVAVLARGDQVYVCEVFFPTEESLEAHSEGLLEALATFEVMQ